MEHHCGMVIDEAAVRLAPNNQREATSTDSQFQQELAEPGVLSTPVTASDALNSAKATSAVRRSNWTQFHHNRSGRNTMTHVF